jgi:hypothetical protein
VRWGGKKGQRAGPAGPGGLSCEPNDGTFDPMGETWWTLTMALPLPFLEPHGVLPFGFLAIHPPTFRHSGLKFRPFAKWL